MRITIFLYATIDSRSVNWLCKTRHLFIQLGPEDGEFIPHWRVPYFGQTRGQNLVQRRQAGDFGKMHQR